MMNKGSDATVIPAGMQPGARPYLHTLEAGAKLPLLQSLVWAFVTAAGVGVAVLAGRPVWPDFLLWPAGGFVAGFALAWLAYQRHWFRLSSLERLTGLDLNGDGLIGDRVQVRRAPVVVPVQVNEIATDGHVHVTKQFDLPASEEQLEMVAFGVLRQGVPFTFREWTGKGKPFSDDEFTRLRGEMIKRGLLAQSGADARRGLELTLVGRRVLGRFLGEAE